MITVPSDRQEMGNSLLPPITPGPITSENYTDLDITSKLLEFDRGGSLPQTSAGDSIQPS